LSANRKSLSMVTPDSTWYHFTNDAEANISLEGYYDLAIDPYDNKFYHLVNSSIEMLCILSESSALLFAVRVAKNLEPSEFISSNPSFVPTHF